MLIEIIIQLVTGAALLVLVYELAKRWNGEVL